MSVGTLAGSLVAIEIEEQAFVEQFVTHPAVQACIGLSGAMKCQTTPQSCVQASMAFEVNSVP
jgi:hypothetical protein